MGLCFLTRPRISSMSSLRVKNTSWSATETALLVCGIVVFLSFFHSAIVKVDKYLIFAEPFVVFSASQI